MLGIVDTLFNRMNCRQNTLGCSSLIGTEIEFYIQYLSHAFPVTCTKLVVVYR